MHLLEVPESILLKIFRQLGLKDILALGDSHKELFNIIYKSPSIWNNNGLLFPTGDRTITDKFIQRIIPRITRHYGVQELKMIDLPLTWTGYLMIFDQFAHTVNRIEIKLDELEQLEKLVDHLTVFAGNLAILQQNNRIPITFRQYAMDDEEEFISALRDTEYLGQKTLHDLNDQFERMKLDDPPFERLRDFCIMVHGSQQVKSVTMRRLELVASFLSGRYIRITTGPAAGAAAAVASASASASTIISSSKAYNKRQREHESTTATTNKHARHYSPKRQETHSLPSYSSFA